MRNTAAERCRCGGNAARRHAGKSERERLQIAVGVVRDAKSGHVLIAKRREDSPHAGFWEFPGGKCRAGEPPAEALRRELLEETAVTVDAAEPLLCIDHDYPDAAVRLHVFSVRRWHGEAVGREGQAIEWLPVSRLPSRSFPAANRAIVATLTLPALYVITPDLEDYDDEFFALAAVIVGAGVKLIQFRSTRLAGAGRMRVIGRLAELCAAAGVRLVINGGIGEVPRGGGGLHLSSSRLLQANERPIDPERLAGASCHNAIELAHAARLGLDFAVLGPVRGTRTHPGVEPMGWRRFGRLAAAAEIPVYALGGVNPADMAVARRNGAHGLAMIGGIWSAPDPVAAVAACLSA